MSFPVVAALTLSQKLPFCVCIIVPQFIQPLCVSEIYELFSFLKVERDISDNVLALIRTTGDFIHQGREVQVRTFHLQFFTSSLELRGTSHEWTRAHNQGVLAKRCGEGCGWDGEGEGGGGGGFGGSVLPSLNAITVAC